MKKCPDCEEIYFNTSTTCENCGQKLEPISLDARGRAVKPRQPKKPRKEVEYVRISHGRVIKKSTIDWIQKRDEPVTGMIWLFFGISIFALLVKGCN